MTDPSQSANSVLTRKLAAGVDQETDGDRTTLRAVRMALARAAQEELSLPLTVIGVTRSREGQGDLADVLSQGWLPILLDGPGDLPGAVCLDPGFVTAVIQFQTMGCVLSGPVSERHFTATDAAMTAPLLDAMFDKLEQMVTEPADKTCFSGFRFGAKVAAMSDLLPSLSAEWYRRFQVTVELGGGIAQGQVVLILPEPVAADIDDTDAPPPTGPTLDSAFGVVRAELTAVLCRLSLSLNDLTELKSGDLIPLARDGFDQTELVAINGETVSICRLGQLGGMRAVRANETSQIPEHTEMADGGFQSASGVSAAVVDVPVEPDPVPAATVASSVPAMIEPPGAAMQDYDIDGTPEDLASEISRLAGLADTDFPALDTGAESGGQMQSGDP